MNKLITRMTAGSFILSLLIACNTASDEKKDDKSTYTDLVAFNIKGDVTGVYDSSYVYDSLGKLSPDSIFVGFSEYEDGLLSRYTEIDSTGKQVSQTHYSHYPDGHWKYYYTMKDGHLVDSLSILVDSSGKYEKAYSYNSDRKLRATYIVEGETDYLQVTGGKQYDSSGKLSSSDTRTFNKYTLTGEVILDSAGKEKERNSYELNDQGEVAVETKISRTKDSTTTTVKKFTYELPDAQGNWTLQTELDKNGKPVKQTRRTLIYATKEK